MARSQLIRVPTQRSPSQFEHELGGIIERLRWANSVSEIINIDEQLEGLEAAVKLFKLGWEAQREAALLRLKCLFHIYEILQQPRAPVGRPPTKENHPSRDDFEADRCPASLPADSLQKGHASGCDPALDHQEGHPGVD